MSFMVFDHLHSDTYRQKYADKDRKIEVMVEVEIVNTNTKHKAHKSN